MCPSQKSLGPSHGMVGQGLCFRPCMLVFLSLECQLQRKCVCVPSLHVLCEQMKWLLAFWLIALLPVSTHFPACLFSSLTHLQSSVSRIAFTAPHLPPQGCHFQEIMSGSVDMEIFLGGMKYSTGKKSQAITFLVTAVIRSERR